MASGLIVISAVVDLAIFVYLITWSSLHDKEVGIITFIAVQQLVFLICEVYVVYIAWSYYHRLAVYNPVIPEQKHLPVSWFLPIFSCMLGLDTCFLLVNVSRNEASTQLRSHFDFAF